MEETTLSPELQSRIDALAAQEAEILSTDSPQSLGVQRLDAEALAVSSSSATQGDDLIVGTQGDDVISALGGNDTVVSLAGNDVVDGGSGIDDVIAGGGNDFVDGGLGNDLIFGDSDINADPVFAPSGDDTLNGGSGTDALFGGNGNDNLNGGIGNDNLFGQDGNDTLNGEDGTDILNSGAGNDSLRGGSGNDRFFAGDGNDQLFGDSGNDQLNADAGNDIVDGGVGNDTVFGSLGNDIVRGGTGADELVGGAGNDFLNGGNGNDRLIGVDPFIPELGFGFGENDTLTGAAGSDSFVLGAGTEVFYVGGGNSDFALINDFEISQDAIELPANPDEPFITVSETGDAGQLLPDAQVIPSGSATLTSITGAISSSNDVDLFQISLTGGETFSATTVGGAGFDTELFLFDANGIGVYGNDDVSSGIDQSTLPAGTPLTPQQPGTYFLAITGFQNEPESSGGRIFELTDDGPGLLKPTGPGGELPLSGFTGEGDKSGSYTIKLTGVESAPFSLGASPTGLPSGTGISFENDLIAIVEGVSPLDLSLGSANFVFA